MGKRFVTVLRRRWGCIVVVVGVIWIVECRCLGLFGSGHVVPIHVVLVVA